MAGKILNGLYVYPGEKQIRDIGVAKNMGCYLKVNGIHRTQDEEKQSRD